jgi:hypothetical protein
MNKTPIDLYAMISPYLEQLTWQLDAIVPGVYDRLQELDRLPETSRKAVLGTLLDYACKSQNCANIQPAREAIARIPQRTLTQILEPAINTYLDIDDEWEYRRLLELLKDRDPHLLARYVDRGLVAGNLEVREAAQDFVSR